MSPTSMEGVEIPEGLIIPDDVNAALGAAGLDSAQKLLDATDEELLAIHGVGEKTMADIRTLAGLVAAKETADAAPEDPTEPETASGVGTENPTGNASSDPLDGDLQPEPVSKKRPRETAQQEIARLKVELKGVRAGIANGFNHRHAERVRRIRMRLRELGVEVD